MGNSTNDLVQIHFLYNDEWLAVVSKPSGMNSHRMPQDAPGESMMEVVRDHLGHWVYPCHRLDRATSGVLVFAKSARAAEIVNQQFRNRTVKKTYEGLARGWITKSVYVDSPVRIEDGSRIEAQSDVIPLERYELKIPTGRYESTRLSWVQIQPHSGRRHQIRLHLSHLRHPLIGDSNYGDSDYNRMGRSHLNATRLMLHARQIDFQHPEAQTPIRIVCDLPEEMTRVQTQLRQSLSI